MGNSTAAQIEPITYALVGIFAAAALVAIAVAAARHFLRKGEDASAPSGFASRASHVVGYILAGGLIAAGGASISRLAKETGGEAAIQDAASMTGSGANPFAPTKSTGLEPIQGERSDLGKAADRAMKLIQKEVARASKEEARGKIAQAIKGVAATADGSVSVIPIQDDETARRLLSASDYLRYKSGVKFQAVKASDGSQLIRAIS